MKPARHVGLLLFGLLAAAMTGGVDRKAAKLNRDGNRAYAEQRYEEAAKQYGEAQTRAPESPAVAYNLGNTQYRLGNHAEAVAHLRRAAESEQMPLRQPCLYNLGNALHRMGQVDKAVEEGRKASRSPALAPAGD